MIQDISPYRLDTAYRNPAGEMESRAVFLFRAGKEPVYLLGQAVPGCRGLGYFPICELKGVLPEWVFFAGATAPAFKPLV